MHDVVSQLVGLPQAIDAIDRLTGAVERLGKAVEGLGPGQVLRYTTAKDVTSDTVDENTMASVLGIAKRTLGEHRRRGRLPGCWVKNRGRICWMSEQTVQAWKRGIA